MHDFGIGIVNYEPDWYGVANTGVLLAGIIFVILCGMVRILYEGKFGLPRTMKAIALAGVLLAVTIPAFCFYEVDENLKDEGRTRNFGDGWMSTLNALRGNTLNAGGGAPMVRILEQDVDRNAVHQII